MVTAVSDHLLLIGMPVYGSVGLKTLGCIENTIYHLIAQRIPHGFEHPQTSMVARARNICMARFLSAELPGERRFSHLLFVDSDMTWEPDAITRLLAHGKDVIGAPAIKKTLARDEWNWKAPAGGQLERDGDACRVDYIGTGFLMISRACAEKMRETVRETWHGASLQNEVSDAERAEMFEFFCSGTVVENGHAVYKGEDVQFCEAWRALGGDVWMDPTIEIGHVGEHEFRGDIRRVISGKPATTDDAA